MLDRAEVHNIDVTLIAFAKNENWPASARRAFWLIRFTALRELQVEFASVDEYVEWMEAVVRTGATSFHDRGPRLTLIGPHK
jgi:hypothetical protein